MTDNELTSILKKYRQMDIPIIINNTGKICKSWSTYQDGIYSNLGNKCATIDTENPEQQFKTKDGRIFSVQQLTGNGYTQDRILNGITAGAIFPLEKKNQVQNPLANGTTPLDATAKTDMSTSAAVAQPPTTQQAPSQDYSKEYEALESELRSKSTTQQKKTDIVKSEVEPNLDYLSALKQKIEQLSLGKSEDEIYNTIVDFQTNPTKPLPTTLEEKAALEKMQHSNNFKPHPDKNDKSFFDKIREMFG